MAKIKTLKSIEVFNGLTPEEFELLCNSVTTITFKNNETIFKEGQDISHLLFIKSGFVKRCSIANFNYKLVDIVNTNKFVDIVYSIYFKKYIYNCISGGDKTQILFININFIKELLLKNIHFTNAVLQNVCESVSLMHSFKNDILNKQVKAKVAYALLYFESILFDEDYNMLISKHELAELLYIAHENLSRTLREFSKTNLIEIKGKSIKILNHKLLLKICNS